MMVSFFGSLQFIMSQVFSESNEVLRRLWREHNPQEEEYLEKEKVVEWIKAALKETNTLPNFEQSMTDLDGLIRQYLSEVHEVTEENTQNLSLSYTEGVEFLRWMTNTDRQEKQLDNAEKQLEKQEPFEQKEELKNVEDEYQQSYEKEEEMQPFQQQPIKLHEQPAHIREHKPHHVEEALEEHEYNFNKVKTQLNSKENQAANNDQDINENQTSNPNQFNLEHLSRKYKDYLKIIFDHYCKRTYATGQDPTFEQIMHKTTVMTITKFMMFCKEFQIAKTNPIINRSYLIEIFKKNSECYKEMSFEQFCDVFKKLSTAGIQSNPSEGAQQQEKSLLSQEMVKFLQFCELSTPKKFKEKMKKLNIQYRAGPKTNAELKVVPQGYRFKFTSNNGKSEEQIKQELNQRKIHRSQRKLFLRQKVSLNQNDLSLNKKNIEIKKKELNISKETKGINRQQNQTQSTQLINKILTPLIPPARKMPPAPPKPINTPTVQNHSINTNNINGTNNTNVFKKQLGYAELHKMKQSEGYSRKRAITNSNTRSHDGKGTFKLNSIVQQARLEMMDIPVNQGHSEHLTESLATNSREQTNRLKSYDMNKINSKMQQINDKIKRDRQIQQELTGLLDMDNDEEDEYLMEHLEREKKNQSIVKRLSHKINQLEMKR